MSMDYIRKTYGLDVKRGDRVLYSGEAQPESGAVTGSDGAYLRIRMDGEKHSGRYHPTWKLRVLPRTPAAMKDTP